MYPVRFTSFFYIAARFDPVALGQAGDNRLNRLFNLCRDLRRLKRFVDVTLYRNCRHAVTAFEDRLFRTNLDAADLAKWKSLRPVIHQSHFVLLAGINAVGSGTSRDYLRRSDIFTDLRQWRTRQKKLDLFGSFVGGKANQL